MSGVEPALGREPWSLGHVVDEDSDDAAAVVLEEEAGAVVQLAGATYQFVEKKGQFYSEAGMPVDPAQGFKAKELRILSLARPHMRGFHYSWLSFFCAFMCWFAFAPVMPLVKAALGMTLKQVFAVNIASVASTVAARFAVGPLCDKIGPKRCQSFLLLWMAFFVLVGMTVSSVWSLALVRFMIGFGGATFVCTQYWSSQIFVSEIVGVANATSAGWGNLGGGVAQQLMVGCLVFFYKVCGLGINEAWRVSFVVPALLTGGVGVVMYFHADDSPRGDFVDLYKRGVMERRTAKESMRVGFGNFNSWVLGLQYAACFGVELHMNNIAATYFAGRDSFGLGIVDAGLVASLFGYTNLFARSLGGYFSDVGAKHYGGMRGRMVAQFLMLLGEGLTLIVFGGQSTLEAAVPCLVLFSLFVQAAEGACFGIVPFVEPTAIGGVSAVVGAWGNIGAVAWGMLFLFGYSSNIGGGFMTLGYIVVAIAFTTFLLRIKGHSHLTSILVELTPPAADAKAPF